MFGSEKDLSIALALVISLFKVVTRVSLGLPRNSMIILNYSSIIVYN